MLGLSQVAHAQTAVGPRGPVGPQASVTCTPLAPGANIQSAVNSKPAGTTFCLAAGAYTKQHVVPKAGDKFIGAVGTILDGQNSTNRAFASTATSTNVTVQNLIVKNYIGGYQVPAIDGQNATGWSVPWIAPTPLQLGVRFTRVCLPLAFISPPQTPQYGTMRRYSPRLLSTARPPSVKATLWGGSPPAVR